MQLPRYAYLSTIFRIMVHNTPEGSKERIIDGKK